MLSSGKSRLVLLAAHVALGSSFASALRRDPISGELSCYDSAGIPQCATEYHEKIFCSGDDAEACSRSWCNKLQELVQDEAAHVLVEHCAAARAEPADSAGRARQLTGISNGAYNVTFRVKGEVGTVDSKVRKGLQHIRAVAHSGWDHRDEQRTTKFVRAEENFGNETKVDAAYCLRHGKKYKLKGSAVQCRAADASKNTKATGALSTNDLPVTASTAAAFVVGEYIQVKESASKYTYFKITEVKDGDNKLVVDATHKLEVGGHTPASGHEVIHMGPSIPPAAVKTELEKDASKKELELKAGQGVFFQPGDLIEVQSEQMLVESKNTDKLTVLRTRSGTSLAKHQVDKVVQNLSGCRIFGCDTVSCGDPPQFSDSTAMCVDADKYEAQGSLANKKCAYWECKDASKRFGNDAGCCKKKAETCNSKFRLDGGGDADKSGSDPRAKCAPGKHVKFGFCPDAACDDTKADHVAACCVDHNSSGSEFGQLTQIKLSTKISTGEGSCTESLTYAKFFADLSDAIAKSLGLTPEKVVLVEAPACPTRRALEGTLLSDTEALELSAEFSIALPAQRKLEQGAARDLEVRAQAAFHAFLSTKLDSRSL